MALYSDGSISEVTDLIAYEANLVEVADAEGIDLETKLRLAQSEVGAELAVAGIAPGNVYWATPGWPVTTSDTNTSRFKLDQVVVTQPLRLWHTFQTLAITYRDAYNRKLNDKYLPKWNEYKELARWASNLLYQTGIGVVLRPVPRPMRPAVDWVAGTLGEMTLYVRMTWVVGSSEGAPSEEAAVDVPASQAVRVTPPAAPASVEGWNVYVGGASGAGQRQNSQPLALGQPWTMPPAGLVEGAAVGNGQEPDYLRTVPRFLQRA